MGDALPDIPRVNRAVQVTLLRTGYTERDGVDAMRAVGSLSLERRGDDALLSTNIDLRSGETTR